MRQTPQQVAKLYRLEKHKGKLEELDIIKELPAFDALNQVEVQRRISEWNAYYKRVQNGKAAQLYRDSRDALERGDREKVKANALKAQKAIEAGWEEDLQRPPFRDPFEFYNASVVGSYRAVCTAIEEMEGRSEKAPF